MKKKFEIGSVVVKLLGGEAGRKCVILAFIDTHSALVSGPKEISGIRRRSVNLSHIEPIGFTLSTSFTDETTDEELSTLYSSEETNKLFQSLNISEMAFLDYMKTKQTL